MFLTISLIPILLSISFTWTFFLDYLSYLVSPPPPPSYDCIVVVAGSAGSVVAARLAEAGSKVLLVEAGGTAPSVAHTPVMVGFLQNSPIDWMLMTYVQEHAGLAMGGVSS